MRIATIDQPATAMTPAPLPAITPVSSASAATMPSTGRRPISARKLEANRRNALKSTGPRTPEGKARAAMNARKSTGPVTARGKKRCAANARRHGLWAANVVSRGERAEYLRLLQDTVIKYQLTTPVQTIWGVLYTYNRWLLHKLHLCRIDALHSSADGDPLSALLLFASAEQRIDSRITKLLRWYCAGLDIRRLLSLPYAKAALSSVGLDKAWSNPLERSEPTATNEPIPSEPTETGIWPQNTGKNARIQPDRIGPKHVETTSERIEATAEWRQGTVP